MKGIHKKKRYYGPFYVVLGYVLFVFLLIKFTGDKEFSKTLPDKRVVEVTQLNSIQAGKILRPSTDQEIIDEIRSSKGPISIGGGRFSMGGQVAFENSLHIDMRSFNKVISLDTEKKQVLVQAGITWRDLQEHIDKENLAIKIMQTYANFTVGGSISVNCHGRYVGHGPIGSSVVELKLITASGEVIMASRTKNTNIFNAVIGGYGGLGVISEVRLQLAPNEKVERHTNVLDAEEYVHHFQKNVKSDSTVIFQNGDLYPPNYDQVNDVTWTKSEKELTDLERISEFDQSYWLEQKLITMVSWGGFGKWMRQYIIDPFIYSSDKVVWRNNEASYDVASLEPVSRDESTYVLQEYFIPVGQVNSFIPKMKSIYEKYDINVINVSLRHTYPDKESLLSYAKEEVFAFVIYYKQGTSNVDREKVRLWTVEMTDAILSVNGKWYLPYQPHATLSQFEKAFSNSGKYFEIKDSIDPMQRFTNKLLDKYHPKNSNNISHQKHSIDGYYRDEQQTILTVPEWYLVFNPKEYADFLEAGKNPSDFPYFESVDEYWKLYDRSLKLVSNAYPKNEEYITMLKVIGASITMEYAIKIIYENSIGKLFSLFEEEGISEQEKNIIKAQRAYSDFIYQTAWYEFKFMHWISAVWAADNNSNCSWLRKWERTLFFTAEFATKAAYAQLITWGAKASYEEPITDIYVMVSSEKPISSIVANNKDVRLIKKQGNTKLLAIKRWGAFTRTLSSMAQFDIEIEEIAGNDQILVSTLCPANNNLAFKSASLMYESNVVSDKTIIRKVHLLPVNQLMAFIRFNAKNNIELEHVFDY